MKRNKKPGRAGAELVVTVLLIGAALAIALFGAPWPSLAAAAIVSAVVGRPRPPSPP